MALEFNPGAYLEAFKIGEQNRRANLPDPSSITDPVLKAVELIASQKQAKQKLIQERQKAAPDLLIKLRENKVPAEDANKAVSDYLLTGNLNINSEKFGNNKKKALFYQKEVGGPFIQQEIPDDIEPVVRGLGGSADGEIDVVQPSEDGLKHLGRVKKNSKVIPAEKPSEQSKQDAKYQAKLKTNQPKEKALLNNALTKFDAMIAEAKAIKSHPGLDKATGMTSFMGSVPGTKAKDVTARIDTLKSKTAFNILQEMRQSSPTGGALGAVSDRENQMLSENIASLDRAQTTEEFQAALDRVVEYALGAKQRIKDAYDETYSGIDPALQQATESSTAPTDIQSAAQAELERRRKAKGGQ